MMARINLAQTSGICRSNWKMIFKQVFFPLLYSLEAGGLLGLKVAWCMFPSGA